jgi:hypothetical protein
MSHIFRIEHEYTNSRIAQHRQLISLLQQPVSTTCKRNLPSAPTLPNKPTVFSFWSSIFLIYPSAPTPQTASYLNLLSSHLYNLFCVKVCLLWWCGRGSVMNLSVPPVGAFLGIVRWSIPEIAPPFVPDTIEPIIGAEVVGAGHHGNGAHKRPNFREGRKGTISDRVNSLGMTMADKLYCGCGGCGSGSGRGLSVFGANRGEGPVCARGRNR